jgi:hypothetical protein
MHSLHATIAFVHGVIIMAGNDEVVSLFCLATMVNDLYFRPP